jgi:dolichol-phosphate mannosyltransferase
MGPRQQAIVIPAFRPGRELAELAARLAQEGFLCIVVVDDGSGAACEPVFEDLRHMPCVHLVRHAANLGKGAALKSGMQYVLDRFPECAGVITADADGQHPAGDVLKVAGALARRPDCLILGVFNPVRDSMRIGFVLLRFSALSLLTAVLDNLVFYFAYG